MLGRGASAARADETTLSNAKTKIRHGVFMQVGAAFAVPRRTRLFFREFAVESLHSETFNGSTRGAVDHRSDVSVLSLSPFDENPTVRCVAVVSGVAARRLRGGLGGE